MSFVGPRPEREFFVEKSSLSIPITCCCINYVRDCSLPPLSITDIPTQWKNAGKASDGLGLPQQPFAMVGYPNCFSDRIPHSDREEILSMPLLMKQTNKIMVEGIIQPQKDLLLRRVGSRYMIVETCADHVNMTNVFSLNHSAAALWQRIHEGAFSLPELAEWLAERYRVSTEITLNDTARQLKQWKEFGLIK